MSITLIAAVAEDNVIGKDNQIPWHIPEDLKRFKTLTLGHTLIMGRKTFESILKTLGHPLPGRKNVVVTRSEDFQAPPEVEIRHSVHDALTAHENEDVFIIGGAEIYAQTIDSADRLCITHVLQNIPGDTYFPAIKQTEWEITEEEKREGYRFSVYQKIRSR